MRHTRLIIHPAEAKIRYTESDPHVEYCINESIREASIVKLPFRLPVDFNLITQRTWSIIYLDPVIGNFYQNISTGGYHGIKKFFKNAFLSQMALECGSLHRSGGNSSRFFYPADPSYNVVEQKAAAKRAGRGLLPPANPRTAARTDPGRNISSGGRDLPVLLFHGPVPSGRGGAAE